MNSTPTAPEPGPSTGGSLPWFGLAWVYTGAGWLFLLVLSLQWGWGGVTAAIAVRLAATLLLGIGLCGWERWAWASAVWLAALYAGLAGLLALWVGGTWLAAPSGTLSWTPLLWGLTIEDCRRVAVSAALVAAGALGWLWVLWHAQAPCDVPRRRAFTVLLRHGPWLAVPTLVADGFLLATWWSHHAR
jgi:hypothetical protein